MESSTLLAFEAPLVLPPATRTRLLSTLYCSTKIARTVSARCLASAAAFGSDVAAKPMMRTFCSGYTSSVLPIRSSEALSVGFTSEEPRSNWITCFQIAWSLEAASSGSAAAAGADSGSGVGAAAGGGGGVAAMGLAGLASNKDSESSLVSAGGAEGGVALGIAAGSGAGFVASTAGVLEAAGAAGAGAAFAFLTAGFLAGAFLDLSATSGATPSARWTCKVMSRVMRIPSASVAESFAV